jgi:hypothetical protein
LTNEFQSLHCTDKEQLNYLTVFSLIWSKVYSTLGFVYRYTRVLGWNGRIGEEISSLST